MNRLPEIELMRLLHGELPPERAFELQERLAREPELAEELRRLEATWDRLELPPAAPAPRGFARAVVGRAENGGLWSLAPTRIRAAGFAVLAAGLALGVGIASTLARWDAATSAAPVATETVVASSPAVPTVPAAPQESTAPIAISPPAVGTPAGPSDGWNETNASGPKGTNRAPAPADGATSSGASAASGAGDPAQVADFDYDLPAEDGSFADEGTLADDYWQAFDGTESATGSGDGTGSGSEGL
ncbi:MAG: hypothetical protein ABJC13_01230 [Acidobacteriota bacterium]